MKSLITLSLVWVLALPVNALGTDCPLKDSVYEDADGNGFELEFGPASGETANATHTAIIKHSKRGTIFEFTFTVASGLAQAFLAPKVEKDGEEGHRIHFFGKGLKSSDWDERAPDYAFVEGLGYADYYGNPEGGGREFILGNPLWKFARCRNASQAKLSQPARKDAEQKQLSSAEWMTDEGRIAAYGYLKGAGIKDGRRYLEIDYVEWLSEDECRSRIKAGTLKWHEEECDIEVRIVNENPQIRKFDVSKDVTISYLYPNEPVKNLSWEKFAQMWRVRAEATNELREGLWKIERSDGVVRRIEWVWLP